MGKAERLQLPWLEGGRVEGVRCKQAAKPLSVLGCYLRTPHPPLCLWRVAALILNFFQFQALDTKPSGDS